MKTNKKNFMKKEYCESAKRIALQIIRDVENLDTSFSLMELMDNGIDGELLAEVIEILNKIDFIVDTHLSEFWKNTAEKNKIECKKILNLHYLHNKENIGKEEELKLLQEEPKIFIGCKFDKYSDKKIEADSGNPLFIRKFKRFSPALLDSSSREPKKELIIIDEDMVLLDRHDYSYHVPN